MSTPSPPFTASPPRCSHPPRLRRSLRASAPSNRAPTWTRLLRRPLHTSTRGTSLRETASLRAVLASGEPPPPRPARLRDDSTVEAPRLFRADTTSSAVALPSSSERHLLARLSAPVFQPSSRLDRCVATPYSLLTRLPSPSRRNAPRLVMTIRASVTRPARRFIAIVGPTSIRKDHNATSSHPIRRTTRSRRSGGHPSPPSSATAATSLEAQPPSSASPFTVPRRSYRVSPRRQPSRAHLSRSTA